MAFLKFNKSELVNLSYSLKREIILANKTGAYCNTSIVDCNTRRYHGLLAVPVDNLDGQQMLLLSSLDESIILEGHQFNLAIHRYGTVYEPRGHKYIVDFDADSAPVITYKVGDVVFTKQFLMSLDSDQVLIRYELKESPSKLTLELKPFLAFRNVHALTSRNDEADTSYVEVPSGVSYRLYRSCPELNLQLSCPFTYRHNPSWYNGITYSDEYRRGFDCVEDLLVPGVLTVEMKPGESFVVSASVEEADPKALKRMFNNALRKLGQVKNWHDILVRNAELLKREILALRDKGHTIIFSTHNMASVEEVCDEIALINHSQVVLSGNVNDIKERHRTGVYEAVSKDDTLRSVEGCFTIEKHKQMGAWHTYLIRKDETLNNSALISQIAQRIELRSISEQLPSMQEIFLNTVTAPNNHE